MQHLTPKNIATIQFYNKYTSESKLSELMSYVCKTKTSYNVSMMFY